MRYRLFGFLSVFVVLFFYVSVLFAQQENSIIKENGKSYLLYTVAQGEGFFSIKKRYGVSKDELIEINPELVEKGLRGGQVLKIPVKDDASVSELSKNAFHTITKGESVMGITKRYNISVEQLFDWNPDLSASTFTIGRTIRVLAPVENPETRSSSIQAKYIVKPQETLYGLSKRFGLSVEELAAANGNISSVNIGQELVVPEVYPIDSVSSTPLFAATKVDTAVHSPIARTASLDTLSVAILFPLGLESKGDPEMGKRLLDYYRGFILAADSVRKTGKDLSISFYDTGVRASKIDSIILTGELNGLDILIAPSHSEQIEKIVSFGQAHDIRVVLPFSSKGDWANSNSLVLQMNPPISLQYQLVLDHWKQRYRNANFIFISSKNFPGEKTEFVQIAQKYLKTNGIPYKKYSHHIDSMADIQKILDPTAENLIISDFASIRNLKTILLDLQMITKQQPDIQLLLWGYPEWQTFFLEFGDAYFDLNVHLFTTFYADYSNIELKSVEAKYKHIYQRNMLNTYPRFSLLGYDMGLYLLSGQYLTKSWMEGLQSGFNFKRINQGKGGMINNSIFIVEYSKDQTIKRLNITEY